MSRTRKVFVAVRDAVGVLFLLVGLPVGLVLWVGDPLPRHAPSGPQWRAWFEHPVTTTFLVDVAVCIMWAIWAVLLYAAAATVLARIGRVRLPIPRLAVPMRTAVGSLLGVGVIATNTAAALPVAAAIAVHATTPATESSATAPQQAAHHPAAASSTPVPGRDAPTFAAAGFDGQLTVRVAGRHYTVTVRRHDTLWDIAGVWLGSPTRWPEIYQLNRDRYDQHGRMRHGDLILPGWVLILPDDATPPPIAHPTQPPARPASPPAAPPHGTGQPAPAPTPTGPGGPHTTATPSTGATAPSATPTATPSPTAELSSTPASVSPSGTPAVQAASPQSPVPAATGTHSHDDHDDESAVDGIVVPGGWLTVGLGAALLLAVATLWRLRRHRYIPTPITTASLDDEPDLAAPLATRTQTRIRQTLRRSHPSHLDGVDDAGDRGPTVREYAAADIKPPLPAAGPSGTELAGAGVLPVTAGLGVAGPGALNAARALLVAMLSSGGSADSDAQGRVVVPVSTLATLIGVSAVDLGPMHRLLVTANLADAVTLLEEQIIYRSRMLAEAQAADIATLRTEDVYAEALPQLLLIADTPEPAWQPRLVTAIGLGHTVNIGAALIGPWPHGTTLTVASDGTTTTTTGGGGHAQRLAVLDTDSAAEAIRMLGQAHGEHDTASHTTLPRPATPTIAIPSGPALAAADIDPPEPVTPPAGGPATADPPAGQRARVRVLGPAAVLDADGNPITGLRAKSVELLVYLAVERGGAPLSQIMEALWPDATVGRAKQRLSTCAGNLRAVLRAAARPEPPPPATTRTRKAVEPIPNTGSHYHLDPAIVTVDWWAVRDEYTRVAAAPDDPQRLNHLLAAIAHISGPLADRAKYDWIDTDREHVRRQQIKLYAHAAQLLTDQDPHQARTLLDAACDLDPLSEELARRAMRAAAALGDTDGVRHRLNALRRELDSNAIDMDSETDDLAAALLRDLSQPHHDNH